MRKLITTAVTAIALLISQACYFVPVERTPRRGRVVTVGVVEAVDSYCLDPPGYVYSCWDTFDAYNYYTGTCCNMVRHSLDYKCDYYDQSYYETYCQYVDSCEWYNAGQPFCM